MANHIGSNCYACNKELTENDDIVVCPECGTPYHRACWQAEGKCINEELHRTGQVWQSMPTLDEVLPNRCPNCGTENPRGAERCSNCGAHIPKPEEAGTESYNRKEECETPENDGQISAFSRSRVNYDPYAGFDKDEDLDGVSLGDMSYFIVSNQRYYLPKFTRFRGGAHRITVNVPGLFFPQLWLAYRKMWLPSLIVILISALISVPSMTVMLAEMIPEMVDSTTSELSSFGTMLVSMSDMVTQWSDTWTLISDLGGYISLCLELIVALLGNWFYYHHARHSICKIKKPDRSEDVNRRLISAKGGTSFWYVLGAIIAEYIAMILFTCICIGICMLVA